MPDFRGTAGNEGNGVVVADGFQIGDVPMFTTILEGSATVNPDSIADGAQDSFTITVTGAAVGDFVMVAPPYDLQELLISYYVSAADTVEVVLSNGTGGAVDLASGEWKTKVLR